MTYSLIAACVLLAAFAPLARSVSSPSPRRQFDGARISLRERRG